MSPESQQRILLALPENCRSIIHLDDETAVKVGPGTYRKRVLRYGKWNHPSAPGGVLNVDEEYAGLIARNFANGVWDTSPVTLGHPKTEAEGVLTSTGEVTAIEVVPASAGEHAGLYAIVKVDPTTDAAIASGKIKGCSAGIIDNYVDHEVDGRGAVGPVMAHLALTNEPYIKGLGDFSPVHLADEGEGVLLSPVTDPPKETRPVNRDELLTAAKGLGIDIDALEAAAAQVPDLEAKVAAAPAPEKVQEAAAEAAQTELVAALGEALVGAQVITLAEGEKPTLASVVAAITSAVADGKASQATLRLSEATHAVEAAIKEGKALPAAKDALVKVYLTDKETFAALIPATPIVDLGEYGHQGATDLSEPPGGVDTAAEIDRLAALADSLV